MAGFILVTYIPTFYAVDLGLGLSLVGAVFVFGPILDVNTDPAGSSGRCNTLAEPLSWCFIIEGLSGTLA